METDVPTEFLAVSSLQTVTFHGEDVHCLLYSQKPYPKEAELANQLQKQFSLLTSSKENERKVSTKKCKKGPLAPG